MIVFIDTNIFLDVLLNRKKLADTSEKVLNKCSEPGFRMYTSAISFANISYFLTKYRPGETRKLLSALLSKINIAETTASIFDKALQSEFKDVEDAYQYYTALNIRGIKYFITRNEKDYTSAGLPILSPEKFMAAVQ